MHNGYFEGILQLRNPNKEVIEYIIKTVERKENVAITNIKKVRGGIDFYITSNKYLQRLGKELQNRFGGVLKTSSKLHTRNHQTSKELHRVNVLFRLLDLKKNDIIQINNHAIKIKHIGKKITGINLNNNKKKIYEFNNKFKALKTFQTVVSKTKPEIEVIHPDTFQSVEVVNKKKVSSGKKVKIVLVNNEIYLI